jgi:hypothetical protein
MKTTELFVELVVVGFGALLWIPLTLLSIFGYSWIPSGVWDISLTQALAIIAIVPVLVITYVFGILIDRLGDLVFDPFDAKIRQEYFTEPEHQRARTIIYVQSESLSTWFHYVRSRLRICRGWALNSLFCALSLNALIWSRVPSGYPRIQLSLAGSLLFLLLGGGSVYAWLSLTISEYIRLKEEYKAAVLPSLVLSSLKEELASLVLRDSKFRPESSKNDPFWHNMAPPSS